MDGWIKKLPYFFRFSCKTAVTVKLITALKIGPFQANSAKNKVLDSETDENDD